MERINLALVQEKLNHFLDQDVYFHLETSNGSYASLENEHQIAVSTFVRNATIRFQRGSIVGEGPYKVGLKMKDGWLYADGLTDWEFNGKRQLLLAGHDDEGRVGIALELSHQPF